jgi:hypothetical protein
MPWKIADYEPVYMDDPEPETLSDHQDDACTFCGREIKDMRNLIDVRTHGCIIDGSAEQAERCGPEARVHTDRRRAGGRAVLAVRAAAAGGGGPATRRVRAVQREQAPRAGGGITQVITPSGVCLRRHRREAR